MKLMRMLTLMVCSADGKKIPMEGNANTNITDKDCLKSFGSSVIIKDFVRQSDYFRFCTSVRGSFVCKVEHKIHND